MSSAFSNALSGLNANSLAIDTVSGNLANLNTTGYMNDQISFQDLLSGASGQSRTGASGSVVAQTSTQFGQGSIQTTSQPYDAAIQGGGFFVLDSAAGHAAYTREGDFSVDASGNLLGVGGLSVQGWNAVDGVLSTSGVTSGITLPVSGSQQPAATANFTVSANLNSGAAVGTTFSSPIQVYDAEGAGHTLTVTYTETSPNNWSYSVTIPAADLSAGTTTPNPLATGTLTFDGTGTLTSPAAPGSSATPVSPVAISISGLADGASDMSLNWNLYSASGTPSITQYSEASANLASTQDGSAPGQLTGTSIGANGQITASYSNGASVVVAQIALASVLNPGSMQNFGNNTFGVTAATATPIIGTSDTGSRGQITGGALESSTVDIATQFTNLLTYERAYQANSKVITTEDDVTQSTVGLIQA